MSEIQVEGNVIVVGRTRIHLRFLETFRDLPDGGTEARVKVYCQGCRRFKAVGRVGLRHMGDGVIDLQPNCHECRGAMNARKRGEARP